VNTISTSTVTAGMLAALQVYNGGTRFSAKEVSNTGSETSEPNPVLLQEFSDESHSPQGPEGYTRGMQDPKHRNQMLRSPLKPSWLVAEKSEMDGLYRRKCWVKVLRSSLTPQDKFSPPGFTTRSSAKTDSSINAKSVWSFRDSTCAERMIRALATLKMLSALCRMQAVSVQFSPWPPSITCFETK